MVIVVMKLQDFDFEPVNSFLPVKVDAGKMVGYLPVYGSRDDAESEFPNAKYMEAHEVVDANKKCSNSKCNRSYR